MTKFLSLSLFILPLLVSKVCRVSKWLFLAAIYIGLFVRALVWSIFTLASSSS